MKHLPEEKFAHLLAAATKYVEVGATYLHYKQKLYIVLSVAVFEATNEICVVYQARYGKHLTFIRPLADWLQEVEWAGKKVQRFTKVDKKISA